MPCSSGKWKSNVCKEARKRHFFHRGYLRFLRAGLCAASIELHSARREAKASNSSLSSIRISFTKDDSIKTHPHQNDSIAMTWFFSATDCCILLKFEPIRRCIRTSSISTREERYSPSAQRTPSTNSSRLNLPRV
jgi:hypothetical protein